MKEVTEVKEVTAKAAEVKEVTAKVVLKLSEAAAPMSKNDRADHHHLSRQRQ